jgi:hypothetical protein
MLPSNKKQKPADTPLGRKGVRMHLLIVACAGSA